MTGSPISLSAEEVFANHGLVADSSQERALAALARLQAELIAFKQQRRNQLRKLLFPPAVPKGLYLWGGVGRGKTLLMDAFYQALDFRRKRRVHFHVFMREVHSQCHALRGDTPPLPQVAAAIAAQCRVLCFDEFQVTDVADAMILQNLLTHLFEGGVVLVTTSNQPPQNLYRDGLQRQNFLPTIALVEQRLTVLQVDGGTDYRRHLLAQNGTYRLWHEGAPDPLIALFPQLAGAGVQTIQRDALPVLGRTIAVRGRTMDMVWFDFSVLCGVGRSQRDYLHLAENYSVIFLSGLHSLARQDADAGRRLTWLVDVLYDHRVKLVLSALCPIDEIYGAEVVAVYPTASAEEYQRTVSRLMEMSDAEYLGKLAHHA